MAGALSRRDIEMIFRAETDKATRPIADLGKAAKTSRGQLEGLIDAAEKGDVSLDKLADTTRDLKTAQDELGTARKLLTALNSQEAALEKASAKADEAAKKYRDLKEQVDGAEKPSKKLVGSMEAAGRASDKAAETLQRVQTETAEVRAQIEAVIGPVDSISGAFKRVADTGQEIARGLAVAGAAADDFKAKTAAAAASAADMDRFNAMAGKSPLLQEQIAYISQYEDRVQRLRDAEAALASQQREEASADTLAKARQRATLDDVLQGNKALEAEIANVVAESERLARVSAYQQIAADAKAGVTDVSRFAVAEDQAAASVERFARAIGMILEPNAAANRSLGDIEASIVRLDDEMTKRGFTGAQKYGDALNELQSNAAALNRIAGQIDGFKAQQAAVDRASRTFAEAQAEALRLATALEQPGADAEQLARQLRAAETAVETSGRALQGEQTKLASLSAALKQAGVDSRDLAGAQKAITSAAGDVAAKVGETQARLRGKGGFLGLSPADATNLSYQINDIFTQLASGQSVFITLAQQGPQIWQIGGIQAYLGAVKALLLPLGAVVGALAAVAGGIYLINRATSDPQLEQYTARLSLAGNNSAALAGQLSAASTSLQDLGIKAADASSIVFDLNEKGFNPEYLSTYATAVEDAAKVMGIDAKDAATDLTQAMTGTFDQIVAVNDKYGILTDTELDNIRTMIESGREDEARQIIFDRMTDKLADAARQMDGPWTNAWRTLKAAAKEFGDYIGGPLDRWLKGMRQNLDDAAVGITYLINRFRGFDAATAQRMAVTGVVTAAPTQKPTGKPFVAPKSTASGARAAADAERESKAKRQTLSTEERLAEVRRKSYLETAGKGYGTADRKRIADAAVAGEQATINREGAAAKRKSDAAAKKAQSAKDKAAREAETLQNKIDSAEEQLQSSLDAMGAKVARVAAGTLQDQLTAAVSAVDKQYAKLYRQLDDFSKLTGGKGQIEGKTIEQYRAQLTANKAILANQAQLKVYEDNLNDVLAQRKQLLADIEDQAQRGQISNAEAINKTAEVTSRFQPVIDNLTTAAINFARSIGGATPSAELQAFIAKMERASAANGGDNQADNRKSAGAAIGRDENNLNKILSERNNLVESYNTLVQLGLMTAGDARNATAAAFNDSKAAIDTQLAALRASVEAARELGTITPQAYDAYIAKMKAVGAQADYLDPRFAQLKQGVDQVVSQNAVNGINSIAEGFGNAAAGVESWGDALKNAAFAVIDFFAQTLRQIANLVLQMLVLDAVQKTTGIPVAALLGTSAPGQGGKPVGGLFGFLGRLFHAGGTVGDYGGSVQRSNRFSISPAALAAAPRYHEGVESVGLKANEQVAVLQTGEKVLTEKQQREEAAAKARGQSGGRGLRQVLAFGDDQVAAAMAGAAGEDVTITHLRRNVPLIKQLLDQ